MNDQYNVTAVPWDEGWELHVDGVGVTQVRTLDKAVGQVRDYLDTMLDTETSGAIAIRITLDLGGLEKEIEDARRRVDQAEAMRHEAAANLREVVHRMRTEAGMSVTDSAAALGVSRGRISQLVNS